MYFFEERNNTIYDEFVCDDQIRVSLSDAERAADL